MKMKKNEKKLSFNKETIVNLNNDELHAVYGGTGGTWTAESICINSMCLCTRAADCVTLPKIECNSVPNC